MKLIVIRAGVSCPKTLLLKTILRMKMIVLLMIIGCMQVSATGYGQLITLSEKNASLENVFRKLEKQSGYQFWYRASLIKDAGKVNLNVRNATLEHALKECFKEKDLTYTIIENTVVIKEMPKANIEAQKGIDINGKVTDEQGNPIEGASIIIRGTKKGTSTDVEGNFALKDVDESAYLIFSAIGHNSQTVLVNGRQTINISLIINTKKEEEIVIASTGYQSISKERATGSYDVVGKDLLSKRPVSNISTALQGVVAGMQASEKADGSLNFTIRGKSSLYANVQPLVVVDGFPVSQSDFGDINPNDIESITVLKDGAAASIWGARSANGVIVVVTKKSSTSSRINIEANGFSKIYNMVDLDHALTQANSSELIKYERLAWENDWLFNAYANSFSDIIKSLTLGQEYLFAHKNGIISQAAMNKGLDSLSNIDNKQQLRDLLMRRSVVNQANLSVSSTTDRNKSYGSIMYENRKEGFHYKGYDRMLLNFNNQFKATRFLELSFGANMQYKKTDNSGADFNSMMGLSPYETLLDPDGSYSVNLNSYNREQMAKLPLHKFPYSDWSYNLLREVNNRKYTNEELSARLQGGATLQIINGLTLDSKIQYEKRNVEIENYDSEETFYVRNMVNQYVEYNAVTQEVGKAFLPKGGILRSSLANYESYVLRNQLNFNKNIGSHHQVVAIAGMEVSRYLSKTRTNPFVYGYSPEKLQSITPVYGYGSSVNQFKDFRGNTVTALPGGNTVFGWGLDKYVSYYGNASYSFRSKYTISGSVRNDASNFITDDPSLRWAPLWSVGAMWNMKKESFFNNIDAIDRLSLRATYGKNGNVEKSTSPKTLINLSSSLNPTTGTITASISDNGNPFLSWERTGSTNLGIDFSLLKRMVFGKIDIYHKLGENIMGDVALPAATGTTGQRFNNAEIVNKGIELELGTEFHLSNNVLYSTSITYAYNNNKIKKLFYPNNSTSSMLGGAFVVGYPVGALFALEYAGMIDGVPHVVGPDGKPSTFNDVTLYNRGLGDFLKYEGPTIPPHTLGWINNFNAYGVNVMVLFVGKMGGYYRNPTFYPPSIGSSKTFVNKYIADVYAGDPNIPQFPKKGETQFYLWDRYTPHLVGLVDNSSYLECKEINVEYTLPDRFAKSIKMNRLKVFTQVRDLGMVWYANSKGYNPDWLPGSNRPLTSYMIGANLNF